MKFTRLFFIFLFISCFLLPACTKTEEPLEEVGLDLALVRQACEEANAKFCEALRQGDAAQVAALYTEDAILLPPDSDMIKGKQNVEAFWAGGIQMGIKDAVLATVDVFGSDDLVYEIGKFTLTVQPEGQEAMEQTGKYVVVWKLAADGSWKLHVDIWNGDKPVEQ